MKAFYSENYKTKMETYKDDKNRWKHIQHSWTGKSILSKWIYYPGIKEIMQSLSAYQWHFHIVRKKHPKILYVNTKYLQMDEEIQKENGAGIWPPRLYYKVMVIKTVWYWAQNEQLDQ